MSASARVVGPAVGSRDARGIHCFTSVTLGYLPRARVLAESVRRFHPDWRFHVVICDELAPGFDLAREPFDDVIQPEDLDIPGLAAWMFQHSVVEACTGVKGAALASLLARNDAGAVIYLDPDVILFGPLVEATSALDRGSIVLTPHLLEPERTPRGIADNELTALVHGIYNLGFLAVRSDPVGAEFAKWWRDRLIRHCHDDRMAGMFTDQRWCDLVPTYFENHVVIRHPGYNVGAWNLSQRTIVRSTDGSLTANGEPLVFFHFSGIDGAGLEMLAKYAPADSPVHELWADYAERVAAHHRATDDSEEWSYAHFDDGTPIEQSMRDTLRYRPDVRARFPDPFSTLATDAFLSWWTETGREEWARR